MQSDAILYQFLDQLGLGEKEAELFSSLTKGGSLSVLELSRKTKIPRTTIYRLLEGLKEAGLVEEIVDSKRIKVRAVGASRVELLVKQKERELSLLKTLFPAVATFLSQQQILQQPETKVLFFRGREGIRQMAWNNLSTKEEIRGYTYRRYADIIGEKFIREWGMEFLARGLKGRDIYSDEYLESIKDKPSSIDELFAGKDCWQSRYISSKVLSINHQLDIYNDVVAIYNWYEGEVFGVEIYNEKVARMQKQIFDILWQQAKKVVKICHLTR